MASWRGMGVYMVIVTVLKSGGIYKPEHVRRIKAQVQAHTSKKFPFVCLSDIPIEGVETVKIRESWPTWWSKIELFKHFKKAFYLDLDTTIVGDITEMVDYSHVFTMLQDLGGRSFPASGVMAWNGDYSGIAKSFGNDPEKHMRECTRHACWGDQGFIAKHVNPELFQHIWNDKVVSYKYHCKKGVPDGAAIVCFHGTPKPWDVE